MAENSSGFTIGDVAEIVDTGDYRDIFASTQYYRELERRERGTRKEAEILVKEVILRSSSINTIVAGVVASREASVGIAYRGLLRDGTEVRTKQVWEFDILAGQEPEKQRRTTEEHIRTVYPREGDIAKVYWFSHGLLPEPFRNEIYVNLLRVFSYSESVLGEHVTYSVPMRRAPRAGE